MLNQALSDAEALIAQSNTVVLSQRFPSRMVRAKKHELEALLNEVFQAALRCCANATGARILRVRIHNDLLGRATLVVERSGAWTHPCQPLTRQVTGVEVVQSQSRCTIVLTFLDRA